MARPSHGVFPAPCLSAPSFFPEARLTLSRDEDLFAVPSPGSDRFTHTMDVAIAFGGIDMPNSCVQGVEESWRVRAGAVHGGYGAASAYLLQLSGRLTSPESETWHLTAVVEGHSAIGGCHIGLWVFVVSLVQYSSSSAMDTSSRNSCLFLFASPVQPQCRRS